MFIRILGRIFFEARWIAADVRTSGAYILTATTEEFAMAVTESPIPSVLLDQIARALRRQTTATITGAVVAASGKSHSIEQVLEIMRDVHYALYPDPNAGPYIEWAKTKDARLKKVHGA
jgi:hypothetical protein